jgi:RNA polymerase sigma factor (sigma-70 family)
MADADLTEAPRNEALSLRFRGPLVAYFLNRVGDRSEAEDLAQDVFVRLANRPDALQSAPAYIFTIASNLLKDRGRKRLAHRFSAHRSLDETLQHSAPGRELIEERNPERVLLAKEKLEEVILALEGLGERTRDIFILVRLERMRQRDIAAMFGITVGAVEKHVIKASAFLGSKFQI